MNWKGINSLRLESKRIIWFNNLKINRINFNWVNRKSQRLAESGYWYGI